MKVILLLLHLQKCGSIWTVLKTCCCVQIFHCFMKYGQEGGWRTQVVFSSSGRYLYVYIEYSRNKIVLKNWCVLCLFALIAYIMNALFQVFMCPDGRINQNGFFEIFTNCRIYCIQICKHTTLVFFSIIWFVNSCFLMWRAVTYSALTH